MTHPVVCSEDVEISLAAAIRQAKLDAYNSAAAAVCEQCAMGMRPQRIIGRLWTHNPVTKARCRAWAIHDLRVLEE